MSYDLGMIVLILIISPIYLSSFQDLSLFPVNGAGTTLSGKVTLALVATAWRQRRSPKCSGAPSSFSEWTFHLLRVGSSLQSQRSSEENPMCLNIPNFCHSITAKMTWCCLSKFWFQVMENFCLRLSSKTCKLGKFSNIRKKGDVYIW